MTLPASARAETESGTRPAVSVIAGTTQYRVLVIDDDALVLRSMKRLLRRHRVTLAKSGREALDRLARGEEFDAIFCDLMMPDVSGVDVYRELVARNAGTERKIAFLTGGAFTERSRSFLATIPNPTYEKPLAPERLEVILAEVVARANSPLTKAT